MNDPHKSLRDDVRLLGELLGETLRTLEGEPIYEIVERVRAMAKAAREGDQDAFRQLADDLAALPLDAALPVARAFAHFLSLANVAEQHHRIRRRRAYQRDPNAQPQRGSCEDAFARLLSGGLTPDALHAAVCGLQIELVLTAHPTEVARRTLVPKYNRLATAPHAARRGARRVDRLRAEPLGGGAALPARRRSRAARQHRPRAAAGGDARPLRVVDRRRPRRQSQRDAAGDTPGLRSVALGGR